MVIKFIVNLRNLLVGVIFFLGTGSVNAQTPDNNIANEELRQKFGEWSQICETSSSKCVIMQFALDVNGNKASRFILEAIKSDTQETQASAVITIFVPFETGIPLIPEGINLLIDQKKPFRESFLFCDKIGCTCQFGITSQGLDLMESGANLNLQFIDIRNTNQVFSMDLDLTRFAEAYDAVKN